MRRDVIKTYSECKCGCQHWEWMEDEDTGISAYYCRRCLRKKPDAVR